MWRLRYAVLPRTYGRITLARVPSSFRLPMGARARMNDATGAPSAPHCISDEGNAKRYLLVLCVTCGGGSDGGDGGALLVTAAVTAFVVDVGHSSPNCSSHLRDLGAPVLAGGGGWAKQWVAQSDESAVLSGRTVVAPAALCTKA